MYSRILRSVFSSSKKLSKQKINETTALILPTSLTLPKLLTITGQYSAQNYSSNKQSLNEDWSEENLSKEQSNDKDYDSDELDVSVQNTPNLREPHKYFRERDEAKLKKLLDDNPEMAKLMKIVELEMVVLQQEGECVPSKLLAREWYELLTLKSRGQRRKYYKYLFINEKVNEREKQKKEERRIDLEQHREKRKAETKNDDVIQYGFAHNFMLRRISNMHINYFQQWNSLKALMFGNKIIYDCSYDQHMSTIEARSCAKQINESYAVNRAHNHPFEIYLTNVNPNSVVMETLYRQIPTLYDKDFPITVTEKSYLELFERSKLCYLSSNAPTTLEKYDHETIYIIGAYVDKGSKQPVSFGKAKREGLRMAKLPLDKYLKFGTAGGRDLTLNQMCSIMLDSQCKSWSEALKHVPTRKLHDRTVKSLEQKINRYNMSMEENPRNTRFQSNTPSKPIFTSTEVSDFSHSARAKLREKWNK